MEKDGVCNLNIWKDEGEVSRRRIQVGGSKILGRRGNLRNCVTTRNQVTVFCIHNVQPNGGTFGPPSSLPYSKRKPQPDCTNLKHAPSEIPSGTRNLSERVYLFQNIHGISLEAVLVHVVLSQLTMEGLRFHLKATGLTRHLGAAWDMFSMSPRCPL